MKLSELRSTVHLRGFDTDRVARVLARSHSIGDLRREAQRALPASVFDYVEGGADEEATVLANVAAFRSRQFQPRSLHDVSQVDTSSSIFGRPTSLPLGLAPTGYTRMMHPLGEMAVARAAATKQVPYVLSTVSTTTLEDVAAVAQADTWLQIYLLRERRYTWNMLDRAAASGIDVIEFSVDTAVSGRRVRDLRNGLTIPPSISASTLIDIGMHPRYWTSMMRAPVLAFANLADLDVPGNTISDITAQFDDALTWSDLEAVRARWPGRLVVKGPLSADDALRAKEVGVDGIHLSNHGGRQLDRCVPTLDLVAPVRDAIGPETTVIVDSGIRHGMDIAVALATGADFVMCGRPYLYGVAAAGERGVTHAIDILGNEFRRTLQLLGVSSIAELKANADHLITRKD